jgi:hypothetical protein
MPEVADIFRRYGAAYLQRFGPDILPSHRRALEDLQKCRTPALGGHVFSCNQCGHQEYAYHSCRNRSCPKCHAKDTEQWLAARRTELLPVPYFHVVFTLPEELRPLVRSHQKVLYGLLMKAAAEALIKLARDPHYVGGLIGILVGVGGAWLFGKLGTMATVVVPSSIFLAFFSAAAVGAFFGFYPANQAAQLDPIDALRHE